MNGVVIPTRPTHTTWRIRLRFSRNSDLALVLDDHPVPPAADQAARPVHVHDGLQRMRQRQRTGAGQRRDRGAEERHAGIERDDLALDRIQVKPQPGKLLAGVRQRPLGGAAVGYRDRDVIGVPDRPVPRREHGPVERIQVQVAEQRRQRAALVQAQAALGPRDMLARRPAGP